MIVSPSDFSIETLTLPLDDPLEHSRLLSEWTTAYPSRTPIERELVRQAVTALIEKRRIERIRATARTQKVRTAILDWERAQEDNVAYWLDKFNDHPPSALVGLLRSAAGCRWAIAYWNELASMLQSDGTWLGSYRVGAIQLLGQSACYDELYFYETAYLVSLDTLACQTNPKQRDIDLLLDPREIPPTLQGRDVPLWPRDPAECRARLQALVDRELPRLRALEETLRVLYEEPSKAEAQVMALATVTKEEMQLMRVEQMHEQSHQRAVAALLKVFKQPVAPRPIGAKEMNESLIMIRPRVTAPVAPDLTRPIVGRSEQRSVHRDAMTARASCRRAVRKKGPDRRM